MKREIVVVVALALAGMRLGGVIRWPWWVIVSPVWGNVAFIVALVGTVERVRFFRRGRA